MCSSLHAHIVAHLFKLYPFSLLQNIGHFCFIPNQYSLTLIKFIEKYIYIYDIFPRNEPDPSRRAGELEQSARRHSSWARRWRIEGRGGTRPGLPADLAGGRAAAAACARRLRSRLGRRPVRWRQCPGPSHVMRIEKHCQKLFHI